MSFPTDNVATVPVMVNKTNARHEEQEDVRALLIDYDGPLLMWRTLAEVVRL